MGGVMLVLGLGPVPSSWRGTHKSCAVAHRRGWGLKKSWEGFQKSLSTAYRERTHAAGGPTPSRGGVGVGAGAGGGVGRGAGAGAALGCCAVRGSPGVMPGPPWRPGLVGGAAEGRASVRRRPLARRPGVLGSLGRSPLGASALGGGTRAWGEPHWGGPLGRARHWVQALWPPGR